MSKVTKFEELECWQSARALVKIVYNLSLTGPLAKDYDTKSQLRRAALSSMNNIAGGFSRYHSKDSIRFYDMAQSSAAEVKSMTYVLEDVDYLKPEHINRLREMAVSTRNLTLGFIRYLTKSQPKHSNT